MKKNLSFLLFLCFIFFISCKQVKTADSFTAMNTFMTVTTYSSSNKKGKEACTAVQKKIDSLEHMLSTTLNTSDVYKINHRLDYDFSNQELKEVLEFAREMYKKTQGAFNPSLYPIIREWGFTTEHYQVPSDERISFLLQMTDFSKADYSPLPEGMELDFGAIGKGYAGDMAVEVLKANGIKNAILDLGGNIQTLGTKPDGSMWKVGIRNPWGEGAACALKIESCAVVTSGGYERYFDDEEGNRWIHIFDPKTGRPSTSDIESVTIVSSSGKYADALSTALFVMGSKKALDFWKQNRDFEMIILTKDKKLIYTDGLNGRIEVLIDFSK